MSVCWDKLFNFSTGANVKRETFAPQQLRHENGLGKGKAT